MTNMSVGKSGGSADSRVGILLVDESVIMSSDRSRLFSLTGAGGFLLLSVVFYSHQLFSFFTGADTIFQIDDSHIASWYDFARIFAEPQLGHRLEIGGGIMYRPLTSLLSSFDFALWGAHPLGFHAVDLLLHLLAVALLFFLIRYLLGSDSAAWASAALFLIHPAVSVSLGGPVGAGDILMTVMFLASCCAFILYLKTGKKLMFAGSLWLYVLALLAKELATVLWPLLFLLVMLSKHDGRSLKRRLVAAILKTWAFAGASILFFITRLIILGGMGGYREPSLEMAGSATSSLKFCLQYLESFFWPPSMFTTSTVFTAPVWILIVIMLLAAGAMYLVSLGLIAGYFRQKHYTAAAAALAATCMLTAAFGFAFARQSVPFNNRLASNLLRLSLLCVLVCLVMITVRFGRPVAAYLKRRSRLGVIAYFAAWLLLPLALALYTQTFSGHNMYFSAAAFCALMGLGFAAVIRGQGGTVAPPAAAAGQAMHYGLLAFMLVAVIASFSAVTAVNTSVRGQDTNLVLHKIQVLAATMPNGDQIDVYNLPGTASLSDANHYYLDDYRIKSWLDVTLPKKHVSVVVKSSNQLSTHPRQISFYTSWVNQTHMALYIDRRR